VEEARGMTIIAAIYDFGMPPVRSRFPGRRKSRRH